MIYQLTKLGQSKFSKWVSKIGKPNLNLPAVESEALERLFNDVSTNQTPAYELDGQYTKTKRPEIYKFELEDYEINPKYID